MNQDRRQQIRIDTEPLDVITLITDAGAEFLCSVSNLSPRGFKAEIVGRSTGIAPRAGTAVNVTECPRNLADLLCAAKGRVVWAAPDSLGIVLARPAAESEDTLRALLDERHMIAWSDWEI
ncbi:MAG: PilZ domain-containing protein [Desulfovibrionaceae bacterium]|jgi:hypothetical protein|nr:PilZ domain-containing protein [Desulfovibrionaceae bacterium]